MPEDTASGSTTDREPEATEPEHAPGGESSAPARPVNKLHEWAAAVAIMIVLGTILGWFIWFLRGPSM